LLSEFCIAVSTNAKPIAYYELGMRHAVKRFTTTPIIASSHFPLPFDIAPDRIFKYQVDNDFHLPIKMVAEDQLFDTTLGNLDRNLNFSNERKESSPGLEKLIGLYS